MTDHQATFDGGTVDDDEDEVFAKLTTLLGQIFQFEKRDLDFGMYRVLKLRQREVGEFMDGLAGEVRGLLEGMGSADRIEVCNHLVDFFGRYYQDGDFMTLPRTNVTGAEYAIPYEGEEVTFHWANKNQYYIKTGRSFKVYEFRDPGEQHTVRFEVADAETPINNTREQESAFVPADATYDAATRTLTIPFEYRPLTREEKDAAGTKVREYFVDRAYERGLAAAPEGLRPVLSRAREQGRRGSRSETPLLKRHLNRYTSGNTEDFFIHKDLKGFLERELDFYLKNTVIRLDVLTSGTAVSLEDDVRKATAVKTIANKVIAMLDTTETLQRRLFEKKKLVVSADYCMTLDRIPSTFYPEIVANDAQVAEWTDLFGVDVRDRSTVAGSPAERLGMHSSLVLDTRHFERDFKDALLAEFDDLDRDVGGLMVKSENWQALRLLEARYRGEVQCIYIDPPYNTGNKDFLYKDRYQHSSWLSMITDRAILGRILLTTQGCFFSSIDDNEANPYGMLLKEIFSPSNFLATLVWQKRYSTPPDPNDFGYTHELIYAFRKSENFVRNLLPLTEEQVSRYRNPDNDPRGPWKPMDYTCRFTIFERPNLNYEITNPYTRTKIWPNQSRAWAFSPEVHRLNEKENRIWWGADGTNQVPAYKNFLSEIQQGSIPTTILFHEVVGHTDEASKELRSFFPNIKYTVKPTRLIRHLLQIGSKSDSLIRDFFAGSGTTAHAVLNHNREDGGTRKYILVEMGEYFSTMMKPRVMKVMYAKTWRNGQPVLQNDSPKGLSHIFKYITLEQYEDTLANVKLRELDAGERTLFADDPGLLLTYLLDTAGRTIEPTMADFEHPFAVTLNLHRETLVHPDTGPAGSSQTRPRPVDLPETFAYLLGLHVVRRRAWKAGEGTDRRYLAYLGRRDTGPVAVVWRDTDDLDFAADAAFITGTVLPKLLEETDVRDPVLYVNGEATVPGARSIGPEFMNLLGLSER